METLVSMIIIFTTPEISQLCGATYYVWSDYRGGTMSVIITTVKNKISY
jgi:hypothetical protein